MSAPSPSFSTSPPPPPRVLIVEDDLSLAASLSRGLTLRAYHTECAHGLEEARSLLGRAAGFDLILLDHTLPDGVGTTLLTELRARGEGLAVLFLTAHDAARERIAGLRAGADDYVVKPFEFEELLARIEAVLRRRKPQEVLRLGDLRILPTPRRVERAGRDLELSRREFDLLATLVRAQGRIVSRQELLAAVWQMAFDPGTNVIEVTVMRLRKRVDPQGLGWIETVKGQGYRARQDLAEDSR